MNESTLVPRNVREEILDWLARNAHFKALQVGVNDVFFIIGDMYFSQKMEGDNGARRAITGADVLARRAELHNKPGWANHQWPQIFQNEDGHWFGARAGGYVRADIGGGWRG